MLPVRKYLFACNFLVGIRLASFSHADAQPLSVAISNSANNITVLWPTWAADAVLDQSGSGRGWAQVPSVLYRSNAAGFTYTTALTNSSVLFRVRHAGPPVSGLSGAWALDEGSGTTSADLTASSSTLYTTNTTWAAGRFGSASLRFNGLMPESAGSLAWVSNAANQVLPLTGEAFSLSFWFSPDKLPDTFETLLGNDANGLSGWHIGISPAAPGTNYLMLAGTGVSSLSITGRIVLVPNQWRHVVVTSGNNQVRVYLDDLLFGEIAGALANPSGPLYFGAVPGGSGAFAGRIDEIRTFTKLLSAEDLSLKGCWHLDENSGYLTYDSSLQGIAAGLNTNSGWTTGKSGSGLDLAASWLFIPNEDYRLLPPSGGAFSLSFWLRPRSFRAGRSAIMSCAAGTNAGWQVTLWSDTTNQQLEFTSTNLGGTLSMSAPVILPTNSWSQIDLTFSGIMANAYVNGVKVGDALGAIRSPRTPMLVGKAPGAELSVDGSIDEVRVYGRERAAFEIGPVAQPMWEMALLNSSTNLNLPVSGPPGRPLSLTVLSQPALGTLTWSPNSPTVTYSAGAQKGPDFFVYSVSDGVFTSPPATAAVSVVQGHWISTNGGTVSPMDGSRPDQAWAGTNSEIIDAIWHTNNYYDCFFYGPGEFQTTGWRYNQRATANVGCKHFGFGTMATTIKLVNTWSAWEEGVIFGGLWEGQPVNDFEVHNMLLDCNAENNPKYAVGEPVAIHVPLASTAKVQQVALHWGSSSAYGNGRMWNLGPASEFQICMPGIGITSNCISLSSTGATDVVNVLTDADEFTVWLTRKAPGIDFYALSELEVIGGEVSLPKALTSTGTVSQLDTAHPIYCAVDKDAGTYWASGLEDQVQITLPLEPRSALTGIQFSWNCKTMPDLHRLGAAAELSISFLDSATGQTSSVPVFSHGRSADGSETITFGTVQTTNIIVADAITVSLNAKESGVDYFSLKEVSLFNAAYPVEMRLPSASSTFTWTGNNSVFHLFDADPVTSWANSTQGAISAIEVGGSNLKFTDLKIINFGTKAIRECFAFMAGSGSALFPAANILVENCTVTHPATNSTDGGGGISVVGVQGTVQNAIVRNCVVEGLDPFLSYSHGIAAQLVERSVVKDCQVAFYAEPNPDNWDATGAYLLRSNVFLNVSYGIFVLDHPGAHFDTIVAIGNDITLAPGGYAGSVCDVCVPGSPGTLTNFAALGNIIHYSDWSSRPADSGGGFQYTDMQHALYVNNLIALETPNALRVRGYPAGVIPGSAPLEDCDHPGLTQPGPSSTPPTVDSLLPGYRRAWLNNHDLTGALLPIRYTYFGTDRPASEQQWSEELP